MPTKDVFAESGMEQEPISGFDKCFAFQKTIAFIFSLCCLFEFDAQGLRYFSEVYEVKHLLRFCFFFSSGF